jgi:predicted amidohydrolase
MTPDLNASEAPALQAARRVADAVLYEGYLLYPYRASSSKNQVRWQFGVLGPAGAVAEMVGEDPVVFTECLLQPAGDTARVDVYLRFLQTQWREPQRCVDAAAGEFEPVDELRVGATNWIGWHEAVEQEIVVAGLAVDDLLAGRAVELTVPGGADTEIVRDDDGTVAGRLVRTRYPLTGRMRVTATSEPTTPEVVLLRVEVENCATLTATDEQSRTARRDLAARQSFIGTHLLLTATGSAFVSVVDPPAWAAAAAARCGNARCWPVLAGTRGQDERTSEIVLGSPIILGDYPEIAAESPGQLFDSAEIDEILTLRIMTMTDEEKVAARGTDPRAAAIIDRSDDMPPEIFERLHGALRSFDPPNAPGGWEEPDFPSITSSFGADGELTGFRETAPWFNEAAEASVAPETDVVMISGIPVSKNSRVRLRPNRRADAHDMFLAGQIAIVRRIDLDVDGETHVAVLLEDDPAADLHDWHGRYYYFGVEEIEPLTSADARGVSS